MVTADPRKHLAEYVRGLFESHTLTVRNIVAGMSDEALIEKWMAHHAARSAQKLDPACQGREGRTGKSKHTSLRVVN